jgi:hypothetical protein
VSRKKWNKSVIFGLPDLFLKTKFTDESLKASLKMSKAIPIFDNHEKVLDYTGTDIVVVLWRG